VLVFLSISSVGVFLLFYLSVLLAVLCFGVDKIGEKHRQMKWRETPTDEMERNTDR
jgi:hypothetical protein